jgi:hypothetical protein
MRCVSKENRTSMMTVNVWLCDVVLALKIINKTMSHSFCCGAFRSGVPVNVHVVIGSLIQINLQLKIAFSAVFYSHKFLFPIVVVGNMA